MNYKAFVISSILAVSAGTATAESIDVCSNPSELHEQKMLKYGMEDIPSLLNDCGLGDIFNASGIFDIFDKFSASIPNMDLLCGYSTKDILDWYGVDSDYNYDIGVGLEYDINSDFLKGGQEFFSNLE
ncbi:MULTISPECIES: hypothetical protein [Vibrio harveyi group]|uniref:hypothetical protein n=1 Tax=Vibrio harveyi group TaxID=717610 RepID=UPI0015F41C3C|nr:hypothetical protein [Vibrio alginolyticus]EJE4208690.1 hypothetical protein [Vibrio parahaemolyticus]HDM8060798.1 hypothetical protein [Vibrio harveyi]